MKRLTQAEFCALCASGKIISEHTVYGPKVVLLPSGDYLKVFNPKKGLTKRYFFPKYKAFVRNTEQMQALNIPCVRVKEIYFLEQHRSYAVVYSPLSGVDLRSLAQSTPEKVLDDLIPFLVELHNKGIYFRGIHLGNILACNGGRMGLIDVADLYCQAPPLSVQFRVRNILHLFRNLDDTALFTHYGHQKFLNHYLHQSKLSWMRRVLFNFIYTAMA